MLKAKISLAQRIERYLKNHDGWLNGGEVERLALQVGYKASNASRRCRELAGEGILERKEEKGTVWYRYKKPEPIQMSLI
jgi:DNA-binding IclR family transcriptional regulator